MLNYQVVPVETKLSNFYVQIGRKTSVSNYVIKHRTLVSRIKIQWAAIKEQKLIGSDKARVTTIFVFLVLEFLCAI